MDDDAPDAVAGLAAGRCRRLAPALVRYDAQRRRLWVHGQRMHHGMTGALLAGVGVSGLAAHLLTPRSGAEWALLGSVLMAHDWHDRGRWFQRGAQEDGD